MALSVTKFKKVNQIVNQNIPCLYFAPKSEEEQKQLTVNFDTMSINQIKEYYENLKAEKVDGIGWVSTIGQKFFCAEGTEDVYKKSGFESDLDEVLGRQEYASMRWKIITSASHIDFEPKGLIQIGEQKLRILGIVFARSTGTTPNRANFYKKGSLTLGDYLNDSPKLIILG